ncbi:hypothetical protein CHELA40_14262 [Chelatococcus asaccharovorans]|nr:hypothetical protein CHELA17_61358 [Chelatococcus asaccharovorans]CAH1676303.1 hypothetical protein CHELA40_14262 [Chelatococcus asaccharovorans]
MTGADIRATRLDTSGGPIARVTLDGQPVICISVNGDTTFSVTTDFVLPASAPPPSRISCWRRGRRGTLMGMRVMYETSQVAAITTPGR